MAPLSFLAVPLSVLMAPLSVLDGVPTLTKKGRDWRWSYLKRAGSTMDWYNPELDFSHVTIMGQAAGIAQHFDDLDDAAFQDDLYLDDETHAKSQLAQDGGITKRQHIIPRAHLDRFAVDSLKNNGQSERTVWTHRRRHNEIRPRNPKSTTFCRVRLWTHTAESHWLRWAEEALLDETDDLLAFIRNADGQQKITEYWAMCRARTEVAHKRIRPMRLDSLNRVTYTQNEKDRLAKDDRVFISDVGDETQAIATILVRIRMEMYARAASSKGVRWGIARAVGEEEFILSDLFPFFMIPLDPRRALVGFHGEHTYREEADVEGVLKTNRILADSAKDFTVARREKMVRLIQESRSQG